MGDFWYSDFQTALHDLTRRFFVLIERVRVDIQRGRRLTVTKKTCNSTNVRATGDKQRRRRVAEAVNVQKRSVSAAQKASYSRSRLSISAEKYTYRLPAFVFRALTIISSPVVFTALRQTWMLRSA